MCTFGLSTMEISFLSLPITFSSRIERDRSISEQWYIPSLLESSLVIYIQESAKCKTWWEHFIFHCNPTSGQSWLTSSSFLPPNARFCCRIPFGHAVDSQITLAPGHESSESIMNDANSFGFPSAFDKAQNGLAIRPSTLHGQYWCAPRLEHDL
jgi:hypothetical protein